MPGPSYYPVGEIMGRTKIQVKGSKEYPDHFICLRGSDPTADNIPLGSDYALTPRRECASWFLLGNVGCVTKVIADHLAEKFGETGIEFVQFDQSLN